MSHDAIPKPLGEPQEVQTSLTTYPNTRDEGPVPGSPTDKSQVCLTRVYKLTRVFRVSGTCLFVPGDFAPPFPGMRRRRTFDSTPSSTPAESHGRDPRGGGKRRRVGWERVWTLEEVD
eukprot:537774-Amorphochlora_amoeboformis.AAC.1